MLACTAKQHNITTTCEHMYSYTCCNCCHYIYPSPRHELISKHSDKAVLDMQMRMKLMPIPSPCICI